MKRGNCLTILGIIVLLILLITYFIPITLTENINDLVNAQTTTPLLGILIFHNLFVLISYIAVGLVLIILGQTRKNKN